MSTSSESLSEGRECVIEMYIDNRWLIIIIYLEQMLLELMLLEQIMSEQMLLEQILLEQMLEKMYVKQMSSECMFN